MGSGSLESVYPDHVANGFLPGTFPRDFYTEGLGSLTTISSDDPLLPQNLQSPCTWPCDSSQVSGLATPTFQPLPRGENFAPTPWVASQPTQDLDHENNHGFDWSLGNFESVPEFAVLMGLSYDSIDPRLVDEPSHPNPMIPESSQRSQSIDPEQVAFDPSYASLVFPALVSPISQAANESAISSITYHDQNQPSIIVHQSSSTQIPALAAAPPGRFLCAHHGCTKHFGRAKDRDRHATKHVAPQFPCTFQGCYRNGTMAFYGQDKLRDHVRRKHGLRV